MEYFEQETKMRSIYNCLAFAATEALRKLSKHILEQRETIIQSNVYK